MIENTDHETVRTIDVTDMPFMPATVVEHERKNDGMTLITLDSDPNSNIEIYDDGRAPHRSGETPDWAE